MPGLTEYCYRENKKQRAEEQVSHGRSKTEEKVKTFDGHLWSGTRTSGAAILYNTRIGRHLTLAS